MPSLKAILNETARPKVKTVSYGQGHGYRMSLIGITAVGVHSGEIASEINWGIRGTDVILSSDIEPFVRCYEITHTVRGRDSGYYTLRKRNRHILAEATHDGETGRLTVRGKRREDVVKLYELIRDGETAPELFGGRRGLIRSLRLVLTSRHNYSLVLKDRIIKLEAEVAELKAQLPTSPAIENPPVEDHSLIFG